MLVVGEIEQNYLVFKHLEPNVVLFVDNNFISDFLAASVLFFVFFIRYGNIVFGNKRGKSFKNFFCCFVYHILLLICL